MWHEICSKDSRKMFFTNVSNQPSDYILSYLKEVQVLKFYQICLLYFSRCKIKMDRFPCLFDDAVSISYCTASNGNMDSAEYTTE
jgi:hypothetical protein